MNARRIEIDEHRSVEGFIPNGSGVQFDFWSGAVRSTIRLTDEAFHAATAIYAELQRDKIKEEGEEE